ncbi:MAG: 30S ribosomal protein S18 [Lachnospirales bacterium]
MNRNSNSGGFRKRGRRRKRVCQFCADKATTVDYKDTAKLKKFVSERGKILPRRVTGTCAKHQRKMTTAVKRARHAALLAYIQE